jgi:hypothetical protein
MGKKKLYDEDVKFVPVPELEPIIEKVQETKNDKISIYDAYRSGIIGKKEYQRLLKKGWLPTHQLPELSR